MSRRLSIQYKNPSKQKPKVKFPDELIFLESVKDNDIDNIRTMLRRASLEIDINKINHSGLTALHHAVLENSQGVVELLVENNADVNCLDEDSWTPLHAACSMGHYDVAKFLLENGADPHVTSSEGERPIDLVEHRNLPLVSLLLNYMNNPHNDHKIEKTSLPEDPSKFLTLCEKKLGKIIKSNKPTDDIFLEIKSAFEDDEELLKSKMFVNCLAMIICDYCTNHSFQNEYKLNNEALTKRLPILSKFIDRDVELQLECLYAAQTLDFKYDHPNDFLYNIFDVFYCRGLIKKDVFKLWKKNVNPYQDDSSHKISVTILKDFLKF